MYFMLAGDIKIYSVVKTNEWKQKLNEIKSIHARRHTWQCGDVVVFLVFSLVLRGQRIASKQATVRTFFQLRMKATTKSPQMWALCDCVMRQMHLIYHTLYIFASYIIYTVKVMRQTNTGMGLMHTQLGLENGKGWLCCEGKERVRKR